MPKTKENKPKGAETLLALKDAFAKVDKNFVINFEQLYGHSHFFMKLTKNFSIIYCCKNLKNNWLVTF